jgi:hypothetical protein
VSTIIKCDRCGEEDDKHARHLDKSIVNPQYAPTIDDRHDPADIDLCGYCWAQFKLFMDRMKLDDE